VSIIVVVRLAPVLKPCFPLDISDGLQNTCYPTL
jgi:hypothetical protein